PKDNALARIGEMQALVIERLQSLGDTLMAGRWKREVERYPYKILLKANDPGRVEEREERTRQSALVIGMVGRRERRAEHVEEPAAGVLGCKLEGLQQEAIARLEGSALGARVERHAWHLGRGCTQL